MGITKLEIKIIKNQAEIVGAPKTIKEAIIPNFVTSIGASEFYLCNSLDSIAVHNTIRSIDDGAFSWCDSLASVTLPKRFKNEIKNIFCRCTKLKDIKFI